MSEPKMNEPKNCPICGEEMRTVNGFVLHDKREDCKLSLRWTPAEWDILTRASTVEERKMPTLDEMRAEACRLYPRENDARARNAFTDCFLWIHELFTFTAPRSAQGGDDK